MSSIDEKALASLGQTGEELVFARWCIEKYLESAKSSEGDEEKLSRIVYDAIDVSATCEHNARNIMYAIRPYLRSTQQREEAAKQKQPEVGIGILAERFSKKLWEINFEAWAIIPADQFEECMDAALIDSKLQSGGDVCDKCGEKPTKIIGKHIFDTHTKTEESYYCFECNKTPNQRR